MYNNFTMLKNSFHICLYISIRYRIYDDEVFGKTKEERRQDSNASQHSLANGPLSPGAVNGNSQSSAQAK